MREQPDIPSRARRWLTRLATTLAAWLVAFLIVLALLTLFGAQLEALPHALNALVFTGVLVPVMGNLVMPVLNVAVARWLAGRPPTRLPEGSEQGRGTRAVPYELRPIGWVESSLVDREVAPNQGDEGSPDAWLVFDDIVSEGLRDLQRGGASIVLTWLDRGRRDVLRGHPRGDLANPERGVFSTRSPDRPNPSGLHRVEIVSIEGTRVRVRNLEALDGTPVLDVKPALDQGRDG